MKNKTRIKIACINNMNNAMFAVARNLRDRGYDAHVFLGDEIPHFLPVNDTYEAASPAFVHHLDWHLVDHWHISKKKILHDLAGFDFLIGTDLAPAYLSKAGLKLDIFCPHGGDIFTHTYYQWQHFPPKRFEIGAWWRTRAQRKGIRSATALFFDYTNDWNEKFFKDLKFNSNRMYMNAPYIYPHQYTDENFSKSSQYEIAHQVRTRHDLIFFHPVRHCWTTEYHYKANDIMIKGFASFVKERSSLNSLLIMSEYGPDVQASKDLISELGINSNVLWLQVMPRKDLMVWLSISDLGIGEFGNSWFSYGTVFETLALKKPFMGYRVDEKYMKHYPVQYPMISANTAEGIKDGFIHLCDNPALYKQKGQEGYDWLLHYAVNKPIDKMVELINKKMSVKEGTYA